MVASQFPSSYPVLAVKNDSYPSGSYTSVLSSDSVPNTVHLTHKIQGCPLIDRWLDEGLASYYCAVAIPIAGYRRLHKSSTQQQSLTWREEDLGEPPFLHPLVVATENFDCELKEEDGVSGAWIGRTVNVVKGAKLAIGKTQHWVESTMHKQLASAEYLRFRDRLLGNKGSDEQKEFLDNLRNSQEFVSWFRDKVPSTRGDDFPVYSRALTIDDYQEPTQEIENRLYDTWLDLTPAEACRASFWGEVTLSHIENEVIDSTFLVGNNRSSGTAFIDGVLSSGKPKDIDDCIRDALRRFSGLPEPRGNRSVYVNCPFGRAWWRSRLGETVSTKTPATKDNVVDLFHINQQYWEYLISQVVSRRSVMHDQDTWNVLVWSLSDRIKQHDEEEIYKASGLKKFFDGLDSKVHQLELGALNQEELKSLIDNEIQGNSLYPQS